MEAGRMLDKSRVDKELARRLCAAFVSCAHYPGGPIRAAGYALARSRAGFFRIDSAFPASAPGRRHIGPFGACSSFTRVTACQVARPPFCGLCREVPTRPVSQPNRSPAIESNHQLFEWVLPPLVICPFRAHAEACPTAVIEWIRAYENYVGS